jgi:DNA-binding CsgD family transcriptional regulator
MPLLSERYVERVRLALDDAGLDHEPDEATKLVSWSIKQGRNLPWWKFHERRILEIEGGYANVHLSVMALCIGLVKSQGLSLADAAQQAGDEFRAGIRRQWDVGSGPIKEPSSLEDLAYKYASRTRHGTASAAVEANEVKDRIVYNLSFDTDSQSPFDETQMTDPRLIEAWTVATEKERDVLRMVADGITVQNASAHLGGSQSLGNQRMRALRERLQVQSSRQRLATQGHAAGAAG